MTKAAAKIEALSLSQGAVISVKWAPSHYDSYVDTGSDYVKTGCTLKSYETCTSPEVLEYGEVKIVKEVS